MRNLTIKKLIVFNTFVTSFINNVHEMPVTESLEMYNSIYVNETLALNDFLKKIRVIELKLKIYFISNFLLLYF